MIHVGAGSITSHLLPCTPRRAVEEFGEGKPEAVYAIEKKLYMDDIHDLDSGRDAEEAINRAKDVRLVLEKGDFHQAKWLSNKNKFNREFQSDSGEDTNAERPLGEEEAATKVLGVC